MSDQPTTEQTSEAPTEVNVTISPPPVWLIEHYELYMRARLKYVRETGKPMVEGEEEEPVASLIADYMGGLALIKAGIVHVSGLDELSEAVRTNGKGHIDLAIAGFIAVEIVSDMNKALNRFLQWKILRVPSTSPNGSKSL